MTDLGRTTSKGFASAYAEPRQRHEQRKGQAFRVALVAADCLLLGLQPVLVHLSKGTDGKYAYNPLAVNLLVEIAKTLFALAVLMAVGSGRPGPPLYRSGRAFAADARHNWLLAVPAFLYAVNNYLKFAMQLHFRPTTTKMLGNLKVFVIALLMRSILGRRFSVLQWEALFLLVAGVTVNQLGALNAGGAGAAASAAATAAAAAASPPSRATMAALTSASSAVAAVAEAARSLVALPAGSEAAAEAARAVTAAAKRAADAAAAVAAPAADAAAKAAASTAAAAAAASSSILPAALCVLGTVTVPSAASVYNELALKRHMDTSVHLQNFFLYFFGAAFNLAGVLALCLARRESLLRVMVANQSSTTLMLVAVNAAQGILASFFYKWADTILKKYSSTIATVATALLSWLLFSHALTPSFLVGVSIVCVSMHQFFSGPALSKGTGVAGGGGGAAADRKASHQLGVGVGGAGGGSNGAATGAGGAGGGAAGGASSGMIVSPSMDHLSLTSAAVSGAIGGGNGIESRQPLLPR
jgi:drug/metabolite transporter (DMT)-like permease